MDAATALMSNTIRFMERVAEANARRRRELEEPLTVWELCEESGFEERSQAAADLATAIKGADDRYREAVVRAALDMQALDSELIPDEVIP